MPVWPNLLAPSAAPAGTFPLFSGIRVFDRDYLNPRIYSVNVGSSVSWRRACGVPPTSPSRRASTSRAF